MPAPAHRLVSEAALSTTSVVVPATSGPLGNRWVFLGDSNTAGATQNSSLFQGESWPLWAHLFSRGRIWMQSNAGVGGDTSAAMLARFDTDVAPHRPAVVSIMAGGNDMAQGVPMATYRANLRALIAKCRDIGAAVVLSTIVPGNDAEKKPARLELNYWLRIFAQQNNLTLFDAYDVTVDRATGNIAPAYDAGDGVHINSAGRRDLGKAFADAVAPLTRPYTPPLTRDQADATNAFTTNSLMLTDTNGDGVADGWAGYGGTTGFSHQLVTRPGILGQASQITLNAADGNRVVARNLAAGTWAVGDRLLFCGVVYSDGRVQATAQMKFTNGAAPSTITPARFTGAIDAGVFGIEAVVTTGTTNIAIELVATAGTGVVGIGQATVLNLTRLGLV